MPTIRTQIQVTKCAECPFFERTGLNLLVDHLMKAEARSGTCKFHGCGRPFPQARMGIADEDEVPVGCPLRGGEVIIQIGAGA